MSATKERDAGRALDAEVAAKICGAVWSAVPDDIPYNEREWLQFGGEGCVLAYRYADGRPDVFKDSLPSYSTDAVASLLVLAKVNAIPGARIDCLNPPNEFHPGQWSIEFIAHDTLDCVEADTLPLAICLAALRALDASSPSSRSTATEEET